MLQQKLSAIRTYQFSINRQQAIKGATHKWICDLMNKEIFLTDLDSICAVTHKRSQSRRHPETIHPVHKIISLVNMSGVF